MFTTIGNWRQPGEVHYQGEVYTWSKHYEYLKFLDLPERTSQKFELALSSFEDEDRRLLESHGWKVCRAMDFSTEAHITARVGAYAHHKTVLLVTHRTSLLQLVGRAIVVDGGKIVADGPRDTIMAALQSGRVAKAA